MSLFAEALESRQLFAVNLLSNGSFETPQIGAGVSGQAFTTFTAPAVLGANWRVTSNSADIVSNAAGRAFATRPAQGNQCVDLNGLAQGTVTQSATTVAGRRYLLRFAYTAAPFRIASAAPDLRSMDVNFGSSTVARLSKSVVGLTPTNAGWQYAEYLVTATSSSSAVTFIARSTGSLGMAIDDVSLVEAPRGTASIRGSVFADGNANGIRETDSIGLSGWRVFLDRNSNGVLDTNEITTTTDRLGNYTISNLAAGNYVVRVVQQSGWRLTTPATLTFSLTSTQSATNKLFGQVPV
jgi:hypothetical protein